MNKLKSLWTSITGSLSSLIPVLFSCCKSGACVGVCATPITSLLGISTASLVSSPIMQAIEPILIAISAVSFTVSYYSLYVLPKYSCNTTGSCDCAPSEADKKKITISKFVFWIGLMASILFLGYFEFQKYNANSVAECSPKECGAPVSSTCCADTSLCISETITDTTSCTGESCCEKTSQE